MNLQLAGKTALLVGGHGTLGRACADVLREEGAAVVLADLQVNSDTPSENLTVDVTSEESVQDAVRQFLQQHGRIDILVTLAGTYQGGPMAAISPAACRRVLDVNLTGTYLVCREVLPLMQRQDFGRIVCVGSLAGQVGGVVAGANYSASKAGVLSLVKSLAKQAGQPSFTITAVNPGPVEGTITDAWSENERELLRKNIPLGRFARPAEVAQVIAFLASPRAAYIHGAHIDINGGLFMD